MSETEMEPTTEALAIEAESATKAAAPPAPDWKALAQQSADYIGTLHDRLGLLPDASPQKVIYAAEANGLRLAQSRLSAAGLHDGKCPEPGQPCTCGIDPAIFGATPAPPAVRDPLDVERLRFDAVADVLSRLAARLDPDGGFPTWSAHPKVRDRVPGGTLVALRDVIDALTAEYGAAAPREPVDPEPRAREPDGIDWEAIAWDQTMAVASQYVDIPGTAPAAWDTFTEWAANDLAYAVERQAERVRGRLAADPEPTEAPE